MAIASLRLVIPGNPISKLRPRYSKFGTYDSQKQEKAFYKHSIQSQLPKGFELIKKSIWLDIVFKMPIPKSTPKKNLVGLQMAPHQKKPDLDNMYKMFDVCNGLVWVDDGLIYKISMEKRYSSSPETLLTIRF